MSRKLVFSVHYCGCFCGLFLMFTQKLGLAGQGWGEHVPLMSSV